jgi:hypothetical protein
MPADFHFDEMVKLLEYYSFKEVKKRKTSGSRVKFINSGRIPIMLHKPHPSGILNWSIAPIILSEMPEGTGYTPAINNVLADNTHYIYTTSSLQ